MPIGATISDRAMSGLSRSLRFAGQAISKERYAKGVKSGAYAYHPKTIRRLEMLEFRRSVIDQYAPHETRGQREEMPSILQCNIRLNQPHESLMHNRCCLKGMAASLRPHVAARQASQFVIHQRCQTLQRLGVARPPLGQQLCEVGRDLHRRSLSAAEIPGPWDRGFP